MVELQRRGVVYFHYGIPRLVDESQFIVKGIGGPKETAQYVSACEISPFTRELRSYLTLPFVRLSTEANNQYPIRARSVQRWTYNGCRRSSHRRMTGPHTLSRGCTGRGLPRAGAMTQTQPRQGRTYWHNAGESKDSPTCAPASSIGCYKTALAVIPPVCEAARILGCRHGDARARASTGTESATTTERAGT